MAGNRALVRILAAVALAAVVGPAFAGESPRTSVPKPPKAAQGSECVEPVADMRRNHMIYLDHQRDETVHQGIRGRKHSLKGCVECHAVPDAAAGGARTVRPFCAECHRYVAVRIDCFGCHARTPEPQAASAPGGASRQDRKPGADGAAGSLSFGASAPAGKSP